MNWRMFSLVTLPSLPVPVTLLMSMPCFFAKCLTAGVANALLPGGAVSTLEEAAYAAACYGHELGTP